MLESKQLELSRHLKELSQRNDQADKAVQEMERNCDQKLAKHKEESQQYLMHIQEEHAALNDLMKYFREDLHRRLLSTDFKMQVNGIEMLQKVLEFLPELFDMLRIEWYTLIVSKAAIFLPCLVEKVSGKVKSLQVVASLTPKQGGEIRKAALNTLATGYKILGSPQSPNVYIEQKESSSGNAQHIATFKEYRAKIESELIPTAVSSDSKVF
ncbi:protein MOR1-like [Rhododendron vialii]|uniref:protein MOR1-like n=1 Tax=Rhododendron vialii TaxID=182163 RepID=UPI00265DFBD3|nr:protein MOR1-like [Rhododendron vialii]